MSRPRGVRNKKRKWPEGQYAEASLFFNAPFSTCSKAALKQLRYRAARAERAEKAAARAWARERGIEFAKLSSTLQLGLVGLVSMLPEELSNPEFVAGLEELARKIRAGKL